MKTPNKMVSTTLSATTEIPLERGKIPPQDLKMEEVVIGALLTDKRAVDETIDKLSPEVFYSPQHQIIFNAIVELFRKSAPIDLRTVINQLKENGELKKIGGEYYLIELVNKISSSAHIDFHSQVIIQLFIRRSIIRISSEIIEQAYDETVSVLDLLDSAESKLYDVTQQNIKTSTQSAGNLVLQARKKLEELSNKEGGVSGVPSGFHKLDELTSGWQNSDLIIVAARPGMGKTALTLSMARNIAVGQKIPVAFFSLEMSSVQLIMRLISSEAEFPSDKLRTGKIEDKEWDILNTRVKELENAPLYIDDTPSLSIFELRAKARRLSSQYGIKIIIIDYLQLMTAASNNKIGGNREQEISTISRNLKALAKELDIPIIALSQLSRGVESRNSGQGHRRPLLSDLRESGAIEQDADIVSFIYRPEYYKLETWDDEENSPTKNQAELIVAKHRNGGLDNVRLKFIGKYGKFDNLDEFSEQYEYSSRMNSEQFDVSQLPSTEEAFTTRNDQDNKIPF